MKSRARIKSPNPRGSITMKEVAAEAGVSTATVSRVLASSNGVADEVRGRVNRAIAKLDYHPNRLARGLRLGQRKVIGVIIPDLQNPFFTGVVHGVEGALYSAGCQACSKHMTICEIEQQITTNESAPINK